MDYTRLIQRAWSLTTQHRFLWVLGLFAGASSGTCSFNAQAPSGGGRIDGGNVDPGRLTRELPPEARNAFEQLSRWVVEHLGLILLVAALIALVMLIFLIVALIARGGMARATADLALGRPISQSEAWAAGRAVFWRFVRLGLVLFGLALLVLAVLGLLAGVAFLVGSAAGEAARGPLIGLGILVGGLLAIVFIPIAIGFGIVTAFADRAIAVDLAGAVDGLRTGLRLVLSHKAQSAIAWIVSLVMGIIGAIGLAIAIAVIAIPLLIVGVVVFFAAGGGLTPAVVIYGAIAVCLLSLVILVLVAVVNAYFWSYWTLVYLRFTDRLTAELEPLRTEPLPAS